MNEWGVVTVIVVLVGLIATFVKVAVSLTKAITTLTVEVSGLREDLKEQKKDVHESFTKVWNHNEGQDDKLSDHETRIRILEHAEE